MWYSGIFEEMEKNKDEVQGKKMAAYMKNQFLFLGIPKPKLMSCIKPYLKESKKFDFDWEFVDLCWKKDYREAQYVAVEYILLHQKSFIKSDLEKIKALIQAKSWWETVDSLDAVVGTLVQKNPELKDIMLSWSRSENIWIRRCSIDFQQKYKENTDFGLLEQIIVNNLGSKEFFINKAIGWSLREYSKVNTDWVRDFLHRYSNEMAPLSVKEASAKLTLLI